MRWGDVMDGGFPDVVNLFARTGQVAVWLYDLGVNIYLRLRYFVTTTGPSSC